MDLLIVEDSPTDSLVLRTRMRRAFPRARIHVAVDLPNLKSQLKRARCDVVITDYWLGWSDGLSVLQRVRDKWPTSRVIFLTGNGGEEIVAGALKYGLFRYLLKPDGFEEVIAVTREAYLAKQREDSFAVLASVVDVIPHAVHCLDSNGLVFAANEAARHLYGYPDDKLVGRSFELILPPNLREEAWRLHAQAFGGNTVGRFTTTRIRSDGSEVAVEMTMVPVRGFDGQIGGVACIAAPIDKASAATSSAIRIRPRIARASIPTRAFK